MFSLKSSRIRILQDIERGEGRFGVGVSPSTGHPRPASASTSAPGSAPTSTPRESSNASRCDLRATAGVGRDVNAGTHQDDGQWTARAGVGAGPMARRSERDSGSGSRWKTIGRFLRRLTFVMFLLGLTAATLALITIYMGPIYLVQLLLVVSVAYFVAGGRLRWFYVALRTSPRDCKWVETFRTLCIDLGLFSVKLYFIMRSYCNRRPLIVGISTMARLMFTRFLHEMKKQWRFINIADQGSYINICK